MKVVVMGAGGHGRSVLWALRSGGAHTPVAMTDPEPELWGTKLDSVPIVGDDGELDALRSAGVEGACLGVGGTGDNGPRERLHRLAVEKHFKLPPVVHPAALVAADTHIGAGSVLLAGAIVGPAARVGEAVIVNSGAIVEHGCVVEDHVHLATGAVLGGGCRIEAGAHVGLGASVLEGLVVGAGALVGAGATVIRDVPADAIVVGTPAESMGTR